MVLLSLRSKVVLTLLVVVGLSLVPGHSENDGDGASNRVMHINLRTRVQPFKAADEWKEVRFQEDIRTDEAAIVICDMWDNHWCSGAAQRVDSLAKKMAPVLDKARAHGILIIHAPSETMEFYKDYAQRKIVVETAKVDAPPPLDIPNPPLPIDDSDGGCDTTPPDNVYLAWGRENAAIPVGDGDVISENGNEVYSLLRKRGIKNLLVMGVHTNMCVLNRSFAIRQMTKWRIRCILVRDLTDSLYNPKCRPYVTHDQGTELVVEYIEQYFCPSVLSSDLVNALGRTGVLNQSMPPR